MKDTEIRCTQCGCTLVRVSQYYDGDLLRGSGWACSNDCGFFEPEFEEDDEDY